MNKFIPGKYNKGFTPETSMYLQLETIYSILMRTKTCDGRKVSKPTARRGSIYE